ncbi:MAG: hypothetical protein WCG25_03145 [bacterium]
MGIVFNIFLISFGGIPSHIICLIKFSEARSGAFRLSGNQVNVNISFNVNTLASL